MKTEKTKSPYKRLYNSSIFTEIYTRNVWGGNKGDFYSGSGSHNDHIDGYVNAITDFIGDNRISSIVEIGCGDFYVSGEMLARLDRGKIHYQYTGYEVVKALVDRNKLRYPSKQISFKVKDAVNGKIVSGDLLIIRQVLQHLDNKSITKIISKFSNYKFIIVTEHQISNKYGEKIIFNKDKKTDSYNRVILYSGVYLEKPPFNCDIKEKIYSFFEAQINLDAYVNTFLIVN
ncbi:SAM-dependent methyltransferase [Pedobacter sp. UYP30]|uniref:class I SAM-dependent methyltransferase n=1 Tax=Pedobacter sp. UYP30 TaxID=1756400 RepID=UPI003397ADFB